jgi:hypothetical protein
MQVSFELGSKPPLAARQICVALRRQAFSTGVHVIVERAT